MHLSWYSSIWTASSACCYIYSLFLCQMVSARSATLGFDSHEKHTSILNNISYFRSPIIYCFLAANIAFSCSETIISIFCYVTVTMNLFAIVTFFYKICNRIINYLLRVGSSNSSFFGLVLAYFKVIKTND